MFSFEGTVGLQKGMLVVFVRKHLSSREHVLAEEEGEDTEVR